MKVLLCVPAYGGVVRTETMQTVASGIIHLTQNVPGVAVRLFSIDMAEISRVRNLFASMALQEESTALIMVDNDMSFAADAFTRLLNSGHDVCGLTYPKRQIDLEKFHASAQAGKTVAQSTIDGLTFLLANDFVHRDGKLDIKDGFVEMNALPGGCLLIRGTALKTLWDADPGIQQTERITDLEGLMGLTRVIHCFDNIKAHGTNFSEDLSFCMRWKAAGGKIYGLADVSVAHYGNMKYEGSYFDWLTAQYAAQASPTLAAKPVAKRSPTARIRSGKGRPAR